MHSAERPTPSQTDEPATPVVAVSLGSGPLGGEGLPMACRFDVTS